MSWLDDVAQVGGSVLQAASVPLAFIPGVGPILSGVAAAGGTAWKAADNYYLQQDQLQAQAEQNRVSMAREDSAVQRRAVDMSRAGFSPLLAAGSPASASGYSVGPAAQGSNDVIERAANSNQALLADIQARRGESEITRLGWDNKLAADTLWAKRTLANVQAESAYLDLSVKGDTAAGQDKPFAWEQLLKDPILGRFAKYVMAAREALNNSLAAQGYDTNSAAYQSMMRELELKWQREADALGVGKARAVGEWSGVVGKALGAVGTGKGLLSK